MGYDIEGRLLEVCTCNVLCPCWVGEDPDYKTCDTTIAWGIEKGTVDGVGADGLHRRWRSRAARDRRDSHGRHDPIHRRDRQPDHPGRDRVQHDPRLAG